MKPVTDRALAALAGAAVTLTGAQFMELTGEGVPLGEVEVVCQQLHEGRQMISTAVAEVGPLKRPPFVTAETEYLQPAWLKLCARPEFDK